ncbi:MAG: helix-turn-helix domain-containing protein [Kofleriaceae bacterium]|nr:helix-turn-helix domain-containing protein [Kofleriaceae bacterium]
MTLLVNQMRTESEQVIELRGYLPSAQLIEKVSWDTAYPTDNHLKQLIRRVRKILDSEGLGNLIESRRGFGYRLRCIPV